MRHKRIVVVSDTPLYQDGNCFFGFGPVVRELQFIDDLFEEIIWIGFNRDENKGDLSMLQVESSKIKIVLLNGVGGKGIGAVLKILLNYPIMLCTIAKYVINSEIVHTRAPSHPALIGVLLSFLFRNKIWWHKYAGNWAQKKPPYSYGIQRWLFKKAKHTKVTVNGFWPNQEKHCFSFENPCLTNEHIARGRQIAATKTFEPPFTFAFVGRLEDPKGVSRILEAFKEIPLHKIQKLHLIGDGKDMERYKKDSGYLGEKVVFHGFQSSPVVHEILASSHFFLLPSNASEGFPKVVAEAACYGCIPVVSDVGSIAHYVTTTSGFIWELNSDKKYVDILQMSIAADQHTLKLKSKSIIDLALLFTFENYHVKLNRLLKE